MRMQQCGHIFGTHFFPNIMYGNKNKKGSS